ncbi:MAG: hypothetical protein Alis3KO_23050 [Aliiglaciecola sp.]|uniref:hypothetical protein n=1 Tax=Aliiglaciecola sp. M165 TaxID=2593649 RepID=UPI00117FE7E0|nr:hypothetical protein [Aliiglaciecola sp. M165]TRY33350.1 hypothetical protein FM019_05065 [Aliiglaciecola sp. M165]
MSEVSTKKSIKTPALLFVVFVLPVVLAYMALTFNWFNKASTNRGELLAEPLDMNLLGVEMEPKWRLLFVMPEVCEQTCENALYSINQIWVASGKASDRVEPLVLRYPESEKLENTEMNNHPTLKVLNTDRQNVNKVFKDGATDGIFIVDTLGNIILRYPLKQQQEDAIQQSRDILADLRKLLKLSRIG